MPSNGPVCSCRFFFLFWLKILQSFLWKLSGQSASFSFGSWWCLTAALRPAAAWSSGWRVGNRHWDWQSSFSWAGWSRNGSAVWDPHSSKRISTPASRKFWEGQSALCWTLSTCVPGGQAIGSVPHYLPTLSFPPLSSPDLTTVMLFLLALLRFSLIQFKEWSTAQLASFSKFLNLPISLLFSTISTGYQSAAGFNTK